MYGKGRAWIELNRKNLCHNAELFQNLLPADCALMPAVKANAYGHGAVLIAEELKRLGIHDYCVASAAEGAELRDAGIEGQILILGYTHPEDFGELERYKLTQTVVDYAYAKELEAYGKRIDVHVGIDTGMRRLGERSDHLPQILRIWDCKNLHITGVFSHLCTSDGTSEEERAFVKLQEKRFQEVLRTLYRNGKRDFHTHLAGSYGVLNGTDHAYSYARVGIALYGVLSESSRALEERFLLKPVLSLKARIECVKTLREGEGIGYGLSWHADSGRQVAAVSIGYADGIPRALSNRGHALVCGRKVSVVGRICMDQLLLDVTEVPRVKAGDEAVLIGESGGLRIRAEDMAAEAGTITNELLSRLGQRLVRNNAPAD